MENTLITVGDLAIIRGVIDLACERGAFKGAELSTVGAVFDKLSAFLDEFERQQEGPEQDSQPQGDE